jgi:cytochrome d ubiquinol oxidase subunit II
MVELWFALLAFTLVLFAVLDGSTIGAGLLHYVVARDDRERREVVTAIGPLWSWHEVWLVAAGGVFLLAFPRAMAAGFAGFYLALWLVLWALILRGIALEVGGHVDDALWRAAFNAVFAASSGLLALLFGVALGNVVRGVPIDASGRFSMALFTTFEVHGVVGLLDWYTLSVALFTVTLLAAHGAVYLRLRTAGAVGVRATRAARWLWPAVAGLLPIVSIETAVVRPEFFTQIAVRPMAWLAVAVVAIGGAAVWTGLRGAHERRTLAGSCGVIAGLLAGAAAGVFPDILHSTIASAHSMTAHAAATTTTGLRLALVWWPVSFALAFAYVATVVRVYADKVRPPDESEPDTRA